MKRHLIFVIILFFSSVFAQSNAGTVKTMKEPSPKGMLGVRYPSVSPDGKELAFSLYGDIWKTDIDGGRATRLTFNTAYDIKPIWSPDGKKLAYVGIEKNRIDIYLIQLDRGPGMPVQLTRGQGDNEDPSWSPDGNLIVFSSTREGKAKLYVMTAFGTDQRRLLNIAGAQTNPEWSPRLTLN